MAGSSSPNSGVLVSSVDIEPLISSFTFGIGPCQRSTISLWGSAFAFAEFALPLVLGSRIRFVDEHGVGYSTTWPW